MCQNSTKFRGLKFCYRNVDSHMGINGSDVTAEDYERVKDGYIETLQNTLLPQECGNSGLSVTSATFKRADSGGFELFFTAAWDSVQFVGNAVAFYVAVRLVSPLVES